MLSESQKKKINKYNCLNEKYIILMMKSFGNDKNKEVFKYKNLVTRKAKQLPGDFPNPCFFGRILRKVHANFLAEKKIHFTLEHFFSSDFQEKKPIFVETFLEVHFLKKSVSYTTAYFPKKKVRCFL